MILLIDTNKKKERKKERMKGEKEKRARRKGKERKRRAFTIHNVISFSRSANQYALIINNKCLARYFCLKDRKPSN